MRRGKAARDIGRRRVKAVPIVMSVIVFLSAVWLDRMSVPLMNEYARAKGESLMESLAAETIGEIADEYGDVSLISETIAADGTVQTICADAAAVNRLKNEVTLRLAEKLSEQYEFDVEVPVGRLLGSRCSWSGGFPVKLRCALTGSVTSRISSELVSCTGASLHRMRLEITGRMIVLTGGNGDPVTVTAQVLIGETVIAAK